MSTKYGKALNQVGERSTFETTELSANMEDYIEAIAVLARENRVVRVKDIARYLDIKMPSVTAALGKLKEKGLVNYEKYGYAELTEEGTKAAGTVSRKHAFLKDFFHDVLRMGKDLSDEEACRLEHHLSPEACRQIYRLVEFHRLEKDAQAQWTGKLDDMLDEKPLSELKEGETAFLVRISGEMTTKKRLLEMGFRRGEPVTVVKYAPLKDPLEITVKGYHLSLRVEEARHIIVRALPSRGARHRRGLHRGRGRAHEG